MENASQSEVTDPRAHGRSGDYILYRGDQYFPLNYCSCPNKQKYVINSHAPRRNSQARERFESKECRKDPKKS
jgi:hypothetical protein